MRILFIFMRENAFNSESVRRLPCGGTEKTTVFLAEALRKIGHEVVIASTWDEYTACKSQIFDVVITQEARLFPEFMHSKRVWWLHQPADNPYIHQRFQFAKMFADQVVTLSQFQHDSFLKHLNIESTIIGHGLWYGELAKPVPKVPYSMIYSTIPYRGLHLLPEIFRKVKAFQPQATLSVCSSMALYGYPEQDQQYRYLFEELAQLEGVTLYGALNQEQLYEQYAKSAVLVYPCVQAESYAVVLDEALAHGCIPAIYDIGAMPERFPPVGNAPDDIVEYLRFLFDQPHLTLEHWTKRFRPKDWITIASEWNELVLRR